MKLIATAALWALLGSATVAAVGGCQRSNDPERDFGTFATGDFIRVKRSPRGAEPAAVDGLVGTLRSSDKPGSVWDAYLTNTDKRRAVRATVVKSTSAGGTDGPRSTVDVPAGAGVLLGSAHPSGEGKDTFYTVVDAAYTN